VTRDERGVFRDPGDGSRPRRRGRSVSRPARRPVLLGRAAGCGV